MSRETIQAVIDQSVLLFDGAMGTYYATLSDNPLEKCEYGSRTNPELVKEIHRQYLEAGCRALKTNTFGIATIAAEQGLEEAEELIDRAWALAKDCIGVKGVFLFADFGPPAFGGKREPEEIYIALADRFLALGARCFLFETFSGDWLIRQVAAHIRAKAPDAFITASFAVAPDGFTHEGMPGAELAQGLISDGLADAAGFNCVSGPGHLLQMVEGMDTSRFPLSVMPNAGYPTVVGGRTIYNNSPEYFAARLRDMAERGVKLLGGCCGTDPDYIRAAAQQIYGDGPIQVNAQGGKVSRPAGERGDNLLRRKLDSGKRVIAVELDSPMDSDITRYMANAAKLQQAGADIITIADCPVARSRMDSSIVACKLKRELDMDVMPHMTCRDRNLNATKALLLGLSMERVRNVLIVTGDPVPTAERDAVKSVYNFNSRMLARYISQLNEGVLQNPFMIGGALNVNAVNFQVQLRLAREKVKNGVEILLTQPVMTERAVENLALARRELDVRLLGGIMPVVSYRNACFIRSELAGMELDDETVERYRDKTKEQCAQLGVELSVEMARRIASLVDGYYLITPFNRADLICQIIEQINGK